MLEIKDKKNCCGCAACAQICPKRCISMEADQEGFYYPIVEKRNCINCGRCKAVCPFLKKGECLEVLNAYGGYSKDAEVRETSSSGGIFSLLASYMILSGGVVFGISMSDDCKSAYYREVQDIKDLKYLQGSKYLQAEPGDTYIKVKKYLEAGKKVLFTGTVCQINGLRLYLGKAYSQLYCMDVICHGVPSARLWKKYVNHIEKKYKAKLRNINFRCKGKKSVNVKMNKADNKFQYIYIPKDEDPYMQMFLKNYCLRLSCYECFAKSKKLADITVGDLWGAEKIVSELNDGKGMSFIIVRTQKGQELFNVIKKDIIFEEVSYQEGVRYNPCEYSSVSRPAQRCTFFLDMDVLSFKRLQKKYIPTSIKRNIKKWMKSFVLSRTRSSKKGAKVQKNEDYGLMFTFTRVNNK